MKKLIMAVSVVLLVAGCGGAKELTQDQKRAAYLAVVADVPLAEPALVNTAYAICRRYENEASPNAGTWLSVSKTLIEGGLTATQATTVNGAATSVYCPEFDNLKGRNK